MYLNSPAVSFPLLTFYQESLRTTGEIILDHEECFLLEIIQIMIIIHLKINTTVKSYYLIGLQICLKNLQFWRTIKSLYTTIQKKVIN